MTEFPLSTEDRRLFEIDNTAEVLLETIWTLPDGVEKIAVLEKLIAHYKEHGPEFCSLYKERTESLFRQLGIDI